MLKGYYTQQEIVQFLISAARVDIDSKRIWDLLSTDINSLFKKNMREGVRYYEIDHDIKNKQRTYWVEGKKEVDQTKPNYRIAHPFHKILVDQKSSYMVGNPIAITPFIPPPVDRAQPTDAETKLKEGADVYKQELIDLIGEQFDDVMNDWVIGSSNKAVEWVHFYIDPEGNLKYVVSDASEIIAIYDTANQNELVELIRYYQVELVQPNDTISTKKIYKVEIWTKTDVTYYTQTPDEAVFIKDPAIMPNPAGHFQTEIKNNGTTLDIQEKSWGKIPFIPLSNTSNWKTDLAPIKGLIDSYDAVKSGWIDDLADFAELIYVVKNYVGIQSQTQVGLSELSTFVQNLRNHKVIPVEGEGGVDALRAEIPTEAKEKFLDITRREIFYFGEGVDIDNDKFGNNPSGISLKFLYTSLDLKVNRSIRKMKKSLESFFWFCTEFLNLRDGKQYDSGILRYTFNKAQIFNEKEIIDAFNSSGGKISEETLLEHHPWVDDVEEEQQRLDNERQQALEEGLANILGDPNNPTPQQQQQQQQQQQ